MTQLSTRRKDSSSNIGSNEFFYRSYHQYDTETLTRQELLKMAIVLAEVLKALNVFRTIHEPLAIISVVVSSTFIYNINGIVGKDDIGKLYLMTELSKFVQEPEVGDFLPRLVILLRDFTLVIPKSFKDYFWKN
ncbi:unnamed protein product [Rhizophagus irregularis]|uniref:Guanylate-binding protein N-terminal domain-containing protein n=1 Tax=Rhizophagus irregularis TaxID=588596 RepID=A0A2N1N1C2_9GLOM|nr:hypothetical protein RhiirC2_783173 [Rhizophagus irregularis]CAB4384179.1 unnamed protein product [Rhizophagus irregularis]